MLEREGFAQYAARGREDRRGGCPRGHGEHELVYQPRVARRRRGKPGLTSKIVDIEIPILHQLPSQLLAPPTVSILRFELERTVTSDISDVLTDRRKSTGTLRKRLYDHLGDTS